MVRARDWQACDKSPGGLRMRVMRLPHGKLAGSFSAAGTTAKKRKQPWLESKGRKGSQRWRAAGSLRIGRLWTTRRGQGKHPSLVFSMGT